MIQRIQSIYLLLAAMFAALATLLPLAHFTLNSGESFELLASGVRVIGGENIQGSIYMLILAVATIAVPVVNIFLYNRRMLQIRICVVEAVLLIGYYVMIGAYYFLTARVFADQGVAESGLFPVLLAPAVSIALSFFAGKAIFKDEILVRSADRIR